MVDAIVVLQKNASIHSLLFGVRNVDISNSNLTRYVAFQNFASGIPKNGRSMCKIVWGLTKKDDRATLIFKPQHAVILILKEMLLTLISP